MSDDHRNAPGERLPWSFVLDPAANTRALGDVQRRGLEAARELVERVASTIAPGDEQSGPGPANGSRDPATGQGPPIAGLVEDWWEVAGRVLAGLARGHLLPRWALPAGRRRRGGRPCRRQADRVAGAERSQWSAHRPRGALAPQPATASGGAALSRGGRPPGPRTEASSAPAACGSTLPEPAELPPRTARGVAVTLSPEGPMEAGIYRGVIQAEGAPNLSITLELTVQRRSSS